MNISTAVASKTLLAALQRATEALARGDETLAKAALANALVSPILTPKPPAPMLQALADAEAEVEAAKTLLEETRGRTQALVRSLYEQCGPGPYIVRGRRVAIVARTTGAGTAWFLREIGDGV